MSIAARRRLQQLLTLWLALAACVLVPVLMVPVGVGHVLWDLGRDQWRWRGVVILAAGIVMLFVSPFSPFSVMPGGLNDIRFEPLPD